MHAGRIITIFGATGFIGSDIVRVLARQGYILRLPCRYPKKADSLKFNGQVGQIVPVRCDFSESDIQQAVKGAHGVVNVIGILHEKGGRTFTGTHHDIPLAIAKACKKENVGQLVHISALGAAKGESAYFKSKLAGEKAASKAFDNTAILRPSLVFGPKDSFFNKFARLAAILPALPLIGGGKTRFQPVYVADVADAVGAVIKNRAAGIYELGGPDILTFKELMEKILSYTRQKTRLVSVPFALAKLPAFFLQALPDPLLTPDQVDTLKTHALVSDNALKLTDLGITPTSMDTILPTYLGRYR